MTKRFKKLILLLMLGIVQLVTACGSPSANTKLQLEAITALAKPTIHLDLLADEIGKMEFCDFHLDGEEIEDTVITDENKIKKIAGYLNRHSFVMSDHSETPNRSPDSSIHIYNIEGITLKKYAVYGNFILKDTKTNQFYRSKISDLTGLVRLIMQ